MRSFLALVFVVLMGTEVVALGTELQALGDGAPRGSAVALIPGTWNSIAPGAARWDSIRKDLEISPYYSRDILEAFEQAGHQVHVVKRLAWFGDLNANGDGALKEIEEWYTREFPSRDVPLILVGHSAGGFYALHVAAHSEILPIKRIFLISTPLLGLELADQVFNGSLGGKLLQKAMELSGGFLDFRGFPAMLPENISHFVNANAVPRSVEIVATAGTQPFPNFPWELADAEVLSPFMALVGSFIPGASDGMVSRKSSYGTGFYGDRPLTVRADLEMNLDHPEQVMDYRIFQLLGAVHASRIQSEQKRFYHAIAQYLLR